MVSKAHSGTNVATENGAVSEARPQENSIALSDLKEGVINTRVLRSGKKVLLIREGDSVKVFGEVCPHMGADLSQATYCSARRTLQCFWHGYLFSAEDGRFLENPNEKIMKLIRQPSAHYRPEKTPRYRLPVVPFSIEDGRVHILQSKDGGAEGGSP